MYLDIVKFLRGKENIYVKLRVLTEHLVEFTFSDNKPSCEVLLSGFEVLNEYDFQNQSDVYYYGFTTLYREIDENIVILSNDGSVYIESETILEYVPTEENLKMVFENSKIARINESKYLLASYLETHLLVSNCHGGVEAQYSVTTEKQSLMASNYLTYTIAKQAGLDAELTWNATGQECEVWTEEEFVTLVLQIGEYVKPLVSLQQSYEVQIRNCKTQEELDAIVISYDVYGIGEEDNT